MKIKITAVLLAVLGAIAAGACDICGCNPAGGGFGNFTFNDNNRLGAGFSWSTFHSSGGTTDHYRQVRIGGNYILSKKWMLNAEIPYWNIEHQSTEADDLSLNGIGDISLRGIYTLLRIESENSSQFLKLSGGISLPSGKFENRNGSLYPANLQTGFGSFSFMLEGQYRITLKEWTGILQSGFRMNTENSDGYTYGDQIGSQITISRALTMKKMTLYPLIALRYDHFNKDVNSRGYYQYNTGGEGLSISGGIQLKNNNWLWGVQAGTNIINAAAGSYQPGTQLLLTTNYIFK